MQEDGHVYFYKVEAVFEKYYGALCTYAMKYIDDVDIVQDLVQDVFVKLIEYSPKFETCGHLRNFLYRSVKNACLNDIQKSVPEGRYFEYMVKNQSSAEDIPDEDVLTAEVFRRLKEAVDELPAECHKVFYLGYFQKWSNEKIAAYLNVSVNTVRAQKARGKKLLKEKLKNLFPLLFFFPELFL